jgi:hypothetical protein
MIKMDEQLTPIEICGRMASCLNEMAEAKGVARCGLIYAMAQLIELMQDRLAEGQEGQLCTTEHTPSHSVMEPLKTENS